MGIVTAFDAVKLVTDDITEERSGKYVESEKKVDRIRECCKDVDAFARIFDAKGYEVSVDENTLDITVSVICSSLDFVTNQNHSPFYNLIFNSERTEISYADEDVIRVDFVYAGIWNRVR